MIEHRLEALTPTHVMDMFGQVRLPSAALRHQARSRVILKTSMDMKVFGGSTHLMDRSSLMKRLLDLRALVVAALLLVSGSALAQSLTFGVSAGYGMDLQRPTKLAASALVTLGLAYTFDLN